MNLTEAYTGEHPALSFELFPPKTEKGEQTLFGHVAELMKFEPAYITCTYGAGGSTRDKTLEIVAGVYDRFGVSVATHLTCVGSTVDDLRRYLTKAASRGIENVVALRGDPPRGDDHFKPAAGGLKYANELVELIDREFPELGIAVAGYPETHLEAVSPLDDLKNLRRKVDAGADVVLTQVFYDNEVFFRFRDHCNRLGISVPIIPGILPATSFAQVRRITSMCGTRLPESFASQLKEDDDEAAQFAAGVRLATTQVQQLIDAGARGIHFYVLNKSQATAQVLRSVVMPD